MSTTTYNAHWSEKVNLTVSDSTGKADKTAGTGGSFDASARIEQMFDGGFDLIVDFTVAAVGNMAIGIYAFSTSYTPGAVTVASLLACIEVNGANLLVKESNTTRYTGTGEAVTNAVGRIELTAAGALKYYTGPAGGPLTLRHTSAITAATVKGWKPWRVVTTHSSSGSKFDPVTITGESDEYYDPDVSTEIVVVQELDQTELTLATITYGVHVPDNQSGEAGPGSEQPCSRAVIM